MTDAAPVPAHDLAIVTRPETVLIATAGGGTHTNRIENICTQAAALGIFIHYI